MATSKLYYRFILVMSITECCSFLHLDISNALEGSKDKDSTLSLFINNIEGIATSFVNAKNVTSPPVSFTSIPMENMNFPQDCSQREKLKKQPKFNANSRIKKCCPIGETLNVYNTNQSDQLCHSTALEFRPEIINAVLYDNCIEDMEIALDIPLQIGNPCNASLLYNNEDDKFYVLQDGSLLLMDEFANQTYTMERNYCLDLDNTSGITYAIICITSIEPHLKRSQILIVAILMLVSIPCLLMVSYLHIAIKELCTLHGLSLSLMSMCLSLGFFLHSLVHLFHLNTMNISYAIQFFILSFIFWFFCLCCNVVLNIWFKIPKKKRTTKLIFIYTFAAYCLLSFSGPLMLVIMTVRKGLPGMPSYFIQGVTESIRESQRYFIPPVSTILVLSFIAMVVSFFGFQKIKKRAPVTDRQDSNIFLNISSDIDEVNYEEIKKDAKCISLLGIIMITTWLLEIVTFYSPGPENYLLFMEMIIGLQGVFILLIFLVVRRRRTIILRWWYDRGSHNLQHNMELCAIKQNIN